MNFKIRFKRDTESAWETNNPVLQDGEPGLNKTMQTMKIGDGTTRWNHLPAMMFNKPIGLGACMNLSIVFGESSVQICWTDPNDVQFEGRTLTSWKRTSLVRKAGSYPQSETDGTIVAQTSGDSKDAYKTTAFEDTTVAPGDTTWHYKLFSVSDMNISNTLAANEFPISTTLTPQMIHGFSQAGTLLNYMKVGDLIVVKHPEYDASEGYDGQLVRFMGYDCVDVADGYGYSHAAVFQFEDCLNSTTNNYTTMSVDPAEPQYALTTDTKAVTGKTYYTKDGSTYTALSEGTDWVAGDDVPADSWYLKNPNPNYNYGCNKWDQSNLRQYLNSDKPANEWWEPQNLWDVGAYKTRNGFLNKLPFADILVPIRKIVARSTAYVGGSITCIDRVFLPSLYEVFGTAINGVNEGKRRWDYYAANTDASYRIKLRNGAASTWWLSSPNASHGSSVCHVTTAGASANYYASRSDGVAPAFAL